MIEVVTGPNFDFLPNAYRKPSIVILEICNWYENVQKKRGYPSHVKEC